MAILAYGINYRTAPINVRERIAFTAEELLSDLIKAKRSIAGVREVVIISTCNRTELIVSIDSEGSDPNNRRSLTEIRKSFRAIKLVATAKSLNIMAQVSDAAENLLNRVVDGTISLNVELIPLMDEIRAVLEHLVARAEKGQELDLHLADQLIEKADLLASGLETEKN